MQCIAQHIAAATSIAPPPRARVRRPVCINVLCNDGRNGLFTDRADVIEFEFPPALIGQEGMRVSLQSNGVRFAVDSKAMKLRIHRVQIPFTAEREWYGNWCWNRYRLRRPRALQLLDVMRSSGRWSIDEADRHFAAWWSKHQPTTRRSQ